MSQRTAFFHLGELIEFGSTQRHLHQPARAADEGLYHRPIRLIGEMTCSRAANIRSRPSTRISIGCARSSARWAGLPSMRSAKRCAAWCSATSRARSAVVSDDKKLDALEIETERRAVQLIALRAPMAGDLRDVVAALKISGVVERIGDYAKNIAKRVPLLENVGKIEPLVAASGNGADCGRDGARRARRLRRARCRSSGARVRARRCGRRFLRFHLPHACSRT